MNLDGFRKAIIDTVSQATGIRGYAYAPPSPDAPCWIVGSHSGEDSTMDGIRTVELSLFLLVGPQEQNWQEQLDAVLVGDANVVDAINAAAINADASGWDQYGSLDYAGKTYWSVRVPVTGWLRGRDD